MTSPWVWLAAVLGAVAVAFGVASALQARRVAANLLDAQREATTLTSQLSAGDVDGAQATLARLQDTAGRADETASGTRWDIAARVPWVGPNVKAVRVTADAVDDIATRALPPVVDAGAAVSSDSFRPRDGRIDVDRLERLAPAVATASGVLSENADRIAAIDPDALVGPLVRPVLELQRQIARADAAADTTSRVMELVPAALGAQGPRSYLLVFQTNAEIRSTGGMGGAYVLLQTDGGEVRLTEQASARELNAPALADASVTTVESAAFGTMMGSDVRATNISPDFPRVARIWADRAEAAFDTHIDGVLSLDAVAMSSVLRGIGSVQLANGHSLTADNGVDILLSRVYLNYPAGEAQDAFFEDATARTFDALMRGEGDWIEVTSALAEAASQRRVQVWFRDADQQAVIAGAAVAGSVAQPADTPYIGLYITDAAQSKMQYYLRYDTRVKATTCRPDRSQTVVVDTSFRNQFDRPIKKTPWYVTGRGTRTAKGNQLLTYRLLAPKGGRITEFVVDGSDQPVGSSDVAYDGRPVQYGTLRITPGEEVSVRWKVQTAPGAALDSRYFETPGVTSSSNDVRVPSACR